jgi:hypothetical protein
VSSYSGRGVEHYKACTEGSDDGIADFLSTVHAAMTSVPLDDGFCPSRWKHAMDVMLEKIPGVSRSDRLRIIQLLEADLNQVLSIASARNIDRLAKERKGIISKHQYGRAHKTCMTPVLNKLLTVQLIIQKKIEGIVFDNDAQRCYDRIISGIALACLRRIGHSKNSTRMLGLLWSQLEHHVATAYGVSDKTYSSTLEKLLYGIEQGSCASPILWALLNQLLLTALGEEFECIMLVSVDGKVEHKIPGGSFVDDTMTGTTNDDTTMEPVPVEEEELTWSEEELVAKMQDIIQFFLDVLQVTGGDLAPAKCAWYLICHRWKHGKARLLQVKESHRGINITSRATGRISGVKRKSVEEGHRMLGFHMSGDGNCEAHKKVMPDKAILYSNAIRNSTMWKGESAVAYNSFYMPSLGYGVPETTLTKEECEDIQRPVVNAILPKMGIARSAPRKVVFWTKQYGGLGLTHLTAL